MVNYYKGGRKMIIGNNILTAIGLFLTCGIMLLGMVAAYPAVKAYNKGRNFAIWYSFSILFLPIALVSSAFIKEKKTLE